MACNKSTLLKAALALGVLSLAAYAAFPAVRAGFLSFSPLLLSLLCPLSMLICMKGMGKQSTPSPAALPTTGPIDPASSAALDQPAQPQRGGCCGQTPSARP
ncbi:DUF2933 domain-containing protein [Neisseriaceae bacterium JH1-16]|nr:DUF2933 domain-containing protein [Neisseriaceae bacterium JH1-16]